MKNIVIFGAPGSGKGTQSDKLVEHYGFRHISTGDVLRSEIKNGTELGKTAKRYIDEGQLLPDALVTDILASWPASIFFMACMVRPVSMMSSIIMTSRPFTSMFSPMMFFTVPVEDVPS